MSSPTVISTNNAISTNSASCSSRWRNPALVLGVAILLGHAPLAILHLQGLWQQEQYQYFPFVVAAILAMLWRRWQESPTPSIATERWESLPLGYAVASLTLLAVSILVVSPWLAFVSLNIGLAAVFAFLGRQRAIPYLWGIWLLLWLLVPMPLDVNDRLVRSLQQFSSQLSSTLLNLLGVLHLMSGNILRLPAKEFFVDEACSGIISVMSMIACAAIYAVWQNRIFLHLLCLVLAGVAWALILNVLRIFLIAVVFHYFDFDLSTGAIHEGLGLALFLLMFLSLVSTDYLLLLMLAPIEETDLGETGKDNLFVRLWNRTVRPKSNTEANTEANTETNTERESTAETPASAYTNAPPPRTATTIALAIPFLILGGVQLVWLPSADTAEAAQAMEQALALDEQSLPLKIGPWRRESFESVEREAYSDFGKYSKTYRYHHEQKEGVVATVSLDFPYLGGWHDLCVCYRNSGWTIDNRSVKTLDVSIPSSASSSASRNTRQSVSQEGNAWDFVESDIEDPTAVKAYLAFAGFYAEGAKADPPNNTILFRPWFRLRRRLLHSTSPQLFQVQVFAAGVSPDGVSAESQDLRAELKQLLKESGLLFREYVTGTMTR